MEKMYVLHVRSGFEISACRQLRELGFNAILPMKQELVRINGKWETHEKIIFTQYLFIVCDLTKSVYYKIRKADGVVRVLGNENGKFFEPLRPYEQEYILWLGNGGKPIEPSKIFITSEGDKMIMSGILRKYPGNEIDYNVHQRKAIIYITVSGHQHKVTLPITLI